MRRGPAPSVAGLKALGPTILVNLEGKGWVGGWVGGWLGGWEGGLDGSMRRGPACLKALGPTMLVNLYRGEVGGWVGWEEEEEAVGMRSAGLYGWVNGWVGGWVDVLVPIQHGGEIRASRLAAAACAGGRGHGCLARIFIEVEGDRPTAQTPFALAQEGNDLDRRPIKGRDFLVPTHLLSSLDVARKEDEVGVAVGFEELEGASLPVSAAVHAGLGGWVGEWVGG